MCALCKVAFEMKNNIKIHDYPVKEDIHSWWFGEGSRVLYDGKYMKVNKSICKQNTRTDVKVRKKRSTETTLVSDLIYL